MEKYNLIVALFVSGFWLGVGAMSIKLRQERRESKRRIIQMEDYIRQRNADNFGHYKSYSDEK